MSKTTTTVQNGKSNMYIPIAIIAGVTAVLLTQDDPQTGIPDPPSTPEN